MPKCDVKKFIEIALRHGCSPLNLLHLFRTPFTKNASGWLHLNISNFLTFTNKLKILKIFFSQE